MKKRYIFFLDSKNWHMEWQKSKEFVEESNNIIAKYNQR